MGFLGIFQIAIFLYFSILKSSNSADTPEKVYFDTLTKPFKQPRDLKEYATTYDPNFKEISKLCPRSKIFSSFTLKHINAVHDMIDVLGASSNDAPSMMRSAQMAKTKYPKLHPRVWFDGLMRAQAEVDPESMGLLRPNPIHLFPTTFIPGFKEAVDRAKSAGNHSSEQCVRVDEEFTADNGPENTFWYFRQDPLINAHHYLWHLTWSIFTKKPIKRRGEFFAYFHHDLLARYSAERVAHNFPPQLPIWLDKLKAIEEPYNPHLIDGVSSKPWTPRAANTSINKKTLPPAYWEIYKRQTEVYKRIRDIMKTRKVYKNGTFHSAGTAVDVLNALGEVIEGGEVHWKDGYYGSLGAHNDVHDIVAYLSTPDGQIGVLGDHTAAMRDPVFYRIHAAWESFFQEYKTSFLPPYQLKTGDFPLIFKGIRIDSITVRARSQAKSGFNRIATFFSEKKTSIEGGLDFGFGGNYTTVDVCVKHLDHEEFGYKITVTNSRKTPVKATVRIFMASRFKNLTTKKRYSYNEQRQLFFAMDNFVHTLVPGVNNIFRLSDDSTLTVPWPKSIKEITDSIEHKNKTENNDCGCGFPHHMLVPMGTKKGMPFDLFVMLTDAKKDFVKSATRFSKSFNDRKCVPSHIHCGVWGLDNPVGYPDKKPMGYPFDRLGYKMSNHKVPSTIEQFVSEIPNAAIQQIIVTHVPKYTG